MNEPLMVAVVGGLEIQHKPTGTWHAVAPIEGVFVVNIGDMMRKQLIPPNACIQNSCWMSLTVVTERWTNNRYKSTMHRVISPLSGKDRYSCDFFNEGPLDRMIECIPTCLSVELYLSMILPSNLRCTKSQLHGKLHPNTAPPISRKRLRCYAIDFDIGIVALDQEYSRSKGLPDAQPFPWDSS